MGTVDLLRSAGIGIKWGALGGQALLPRARAELAAEFLSESNASHLLFIDADISWDPRDVPRLLEHGLDVVCGAAPSREEAATYFACRPLLREDGTLSVCPRTGWSMRARWHGLHADTTASIRADDGSIPGVEIRRN